LDCKACGQRSDVDLRLKLSSFILKTQPKKGKKDKADKAERKARRAKAKENGDAEQNGNGNGHASGESNSDNADVDEGDFAPEAGSDDELTRRINAEAKELDAKPDVKDDVWAVDVSEEAVKARAKELPDDLKQKLVFEDGDDDDGEGGGNSSYDQLGSWVISTAEAKGGVNNLDDVDIYVKAKDLGLESKHKTLTVLAQTIFDDSIVEQIPKRASMLKKLITSERHEKAFLGGTERFVGKEYPKLVPQVPQILMACYQEDLITEAVLKNWGSKASKKYVDLATSKKVRQAAQPFLGWLENAESDEEEEEEEEA